MTTTDPIETELRYIEDQGTCRAAAGRLRGLIAELSAELARVHAADDGCNVPRSTDVELSPAGRAWLMCATLNQAKDDLARERERARVLEAELEVHRMSWRDLSKRVEVAEAKVIECEPKAAAHDRLLEWMPFVDEHTPDNERDDKPLDVRVIATIRRCDREHNELHREHIETMRRSDKLRRALVDILESLPVCQYPDCPRPAVAGVVSHEPECCEEHDGAQWMHMGQFDRKLIGLRSCDWAEPVKVARALLDAKEDE